MKVFFSCDMEGTTGITAWSETENDKGEYGVWADRMTAEVKAACEGAAAAGADGLLIKDAHDSARNIRHEQLPEGTRLFRGWGRTPLSMMAGIDESFSAAVFTGYHSAAGMNTSPLAHTMNTQNISVRCNGDLMPEAMMNAMAASYFGVPLVCITGDKGICEYMQGFVPEMNIVPVNEGVGAGTISIHPLEAQRLIRARVEDGVRRASEIPCFPLPEHYCIEIFFKEHDRARSASWYPGMMQTDVREVRYEADDLMDVLTMLHFIL